MSRESLLDLVENMKGSLTSEQYKLLIEEVAKVRSDQTQDEELEMIIISPTCYPVGCKSVIRDHPLCSKGHLIWEAELGLRMTKLILTRNKMTNEQWETWINHSSDCESVLPEFLPCIASGYLLDNLPEFYQDLVWFLIPGRDYQFRNTISYEEEQEERCCELIPDIDQVHVSIKRITRLNT